MDWLEECVEGELPSYDELDAKTRSLLNINGLDNVKGNAAVTGKDPRIEKNGAKAS